MVHRVYGNLSNVILVFIVNIVEKQVVYFVAVGQLIKMINRRIRKGWKNLKRFIGMEPERRLNKYSTWDDRPERTEVHPNMTEQLYLMEFLRRRGWEFNGSIGSAYRFSKRLHTGEATHVLDCFFTGWYCLHVVPFIKDVKIFPDGNNRPRSSYGR